MTKGETQWRRWRITGGLVVGLCAVSATVVAAHHAGDALVVSQEMAGPAAIVSLASHEWERLPATIELARLAPSAKILLTEPVTVSYYNCHECGGRREVLVQGGVAPERVVILPRKVTRTWDEALAVREWAELNGARSVLAVTSPYHTRRALRTFTKVFADSGITVGVSPAWRHSPARPGGWWRYKYDRHYVAYEWSATLMYLVRFGVAP